MQKEAIDSDCLFNKFSDVHIAYVSKVMYLELVELILLIEAQ